MKKYVAALLFPIPVVLILLLVGCILLWVGKYKKTARFSVTLGTLLLLLGSLPPVAGAFIGGLESQYELVRPETMPEFEPDWIVVLDGGNIPDPELPATHRISTYTNTRLVEGMRLSKLYPESKLLLSGGSAINETPGAELLKRAAIEFGVREDRIELESTSWDTDDQSRNIHEIVGDEPFFLVTSASHLPRAMMMFERQGMNPVPAPAGFESARYPRRGYPTNIPSSLDLVKTRRAIYEYLGILWAKIRGHV